MDLLSAFQYGFMLRAMAAGLMVAVIAPLIGMFLVTRKYSFMADTLAHVSLAGIAVGFLLHAQPVLAAAVAAVLAAFAVEWLRQEGKVMGDAGLSLFLSGGLAIASVLLSLGGISGFSLQAVLFGSITTVTPSDLGYILVLGIVVVAVVAVFYLSLFAMSYDEELAIAAGLPVRRLNFLVVTLAAVTVALALRVVGTLLVSALMVIPVLSAMQFKRGFRTTLLLSVAVSVAAVVAGLSASYSLGIASGGSIVLSALILFVVCAVAGRRR
jgi:zinc transport system permease protein